MSEGTKVCSKCGEAKPLSGFYPRSRHRSGYEAHCKACRNVNARKYYAANRERYAEWKKAHRERYPDRPREYNRRYQYGLAAGEWDAMFEAQGRVCAICKTQEPGRCWNTDHCHLTGRVRGILCNGCNVALGHLRDDPGRVLAAHAYLVGI